MRAADLDTGWGHVERLDVKVLQTILCRDRLAGGKPRVTRGRDALPHRLHSGIRDLLFSLARGLPAQMARFRLARNG
jgi:hypothetical protein